MLAKLFGRPTPKPITKVWPNLEQKYRGLAGEAATHRQAGAVTLIVAHFADSIASMQTALELLALAYTPPAASLDNLRVSALGAGSVLLSLAEILSVRPGNAATGVRPLHLMAMEHHPRLPSDEAVLQFAAGLPELKSLTFHASLDDPLLALFGSASVRELWTHLNLPEHEPLTHPLLAQTIRGAQQRVARKATGNRPAASARGWLQANLPPGP